MGPRVGWIGTTVVAWSVTYTLKKGRKCGLYIQWNVIQP